MTTTTTRPPRPGAQGCLARLRGLRPSLSKAERKALVKARKAERKAEARGGDEAEDQTSRLYVLHFAGDIRASAVDGMQYGFRVIVPRECVGDRRAEPHDANLFDIDSKYGDVVSKADVLEYLAGYSSTANA